MTEKRQDLIELGEEANRAFQRLWNGESLNVAVDVQKYLELSRSRLEMLSAVYIDQPNEDLLANELQLKKIREIQESDDIVKECVEWIISSLPRKKDTEEVSDTFKEVEQRLRGYLK